MAFANELSTPARPVPEIIGPEAIRAALKTIPPSPGIYQMIDANGKILYIGKAKNLVNRLTSYISVSNLTNRIMRMVAQVARVDIVVTKTEVEALLVEADLIRSNRPRYNILLKDDKSFPYLRIDTSHPFPRIEKHRGAQNKPGEYYGPFANVGALNETMGILQKIFQLRPCEDSYFKNRTRPCLQYQIKRCTAPCVGYVDQQHYAEQFARARDFLKGRHSDVQKSLAADMEEASNSQNYERAALLRDQIRALSQVQHEQGLRTLGLDNADAMALARSGAHSVVQVFFFRRGTHFGTQSFHPRHEADATDADIMAAFIGQFYQSHKPPPEILVNLPPSDHDLLAEALSVSSGSKVTIRQPVRGDKLTLINNVTANAQTTLQREAQEGAAVAANLVGVQQLFGLATPPQRIEVYDNSHIMGRHALGAFIVATPAGFDKKSYRTFNIRDVNTEPGDDYAMMREVFRRRFKGFARHTATEEIDMPLPSRERLGEGAVKPGDLLASPPTPTLPRKGGGSDYPDLVLIDGGKGQLSAVVEALQEIGVTGIPLVAIAKGRDRNAGREWFFMPGRDGFQLPENTPVLHYLQRLRDEAHRFAIGRHRNKRAKALTTSALDDIPGIGTTRKRALLQHFGSRADVERATLAELENVTGISTAIARAIYDYFHG